MNDIDKVAILPEYEDVQASLDRCKAPQSAAEAHGFANGLQLAGVDGPLAVWQQELYSDFDPSDLLAGECRALLDRLFASVFADAASSGDGFSLFLPDGIAVDAQRLGAVRDWCQGFLYGIGLGGEALVKNASAQTRDLLRDIAEITRLETDDVDNSAENQSALIEIEEYLRVGILLLRDERLGGKDTHDSE